MGLESGIYNITCVGNQMPLAMLAGMVVEMSPLVCMVDQPPAVIKVENIGGDKYRLTPEIAPENRVPGETGELVIGTMATPPPRMLVLAGSEDNGLSERVEWAIDPSGNDTYTIHMSDSDEYWTAAEENGMPIQLGGLKGQETQKWQFSRL
ncbi:unnamed protein product [Rhizoctonia solani]|uniref:Uncharacterized protein n=1 Tax=Rhizoctonia solani TaxID=456999 RepID=A0A8H2XMD4_9AGAM|nr:unnamed protein product [Rhizoctonia solani]CAE6428686.1 unnamed protein product [Rhizoctonia solani]